MKRNYNITLKNSWNDISIDDYFKLKGVSNIIDIISILSGESKDTLKDIPMSVIDELVKETDFIHGDVPINTDITDDLLKVRVEGGVEYYYSLNLEIGQWDAGRFMDFMEFSSDADLLYDNMHLLMVICCDKWEVKPPSSWNPFGKEKLVKIPRSERDLIEEAEWGLTTFPISTTLSMLSFFLTIFEGFSKDIVGYSAFLTTVTDSMKNLDKIVEKWNSDNHHSIQTSSGSFG